MSPSELSPSVARDRRLILLIAGGDEGAFREFYGHHVKTALGLAVRVLRDRALAEDAVQESFLAAWQQAGSYHPDGARPVSWLLTIVHRRAVDQVRRQQRRSHDQLELDDARVAEDAAITGMPSSVWIRAGLDRLSRPEREVLELTYFAGLTQSQIAKRLHTPLGTIKSRTFHALGRMKHELAAA